MLRYIFMDVNPYIIDLEEIYKSSWKEVVDVIDTKYPNLISIDALEHLIDTEPDIVDQKEKWLEELGEEKYKIITNLLKTKGLENIEKYTKSNPLNSILKTFFDDASQDNVHIILVTSNFLLTTIKKFYKLPSNVSIESIEANTYLVASSLVEYASRNNLTCDEFACITQVKATIEDLTKNNIFCVTVGNDVEFGIDKILYLNSIEDLSFSNIKYNFYNNDESDSDL